MENPVMDYEGTLPHPKGKSLRDLISGSSEFQIDLDFSKRDINDLTLDDALYEDDSDSDDIYKQIEEKTEKLMLSSPEYQSFEHLEKRMVDCQGAPGGSVKIHIMEEGDGPLVPTEAEVTIHYAAYWENGKIPFDSTLTMNSGSPMRMRLGYGQFLPGLELALSTVRGPTARLLALLKPEAAWGPLGVPPRIRPETALFVIALYGVKERAIIRGFNDLPSKEQSKFETTLRTVEALRENAKDLFKKKKYRKAIKDYEQIFHVLSLSRTETDEQAKQLKDIKIKTYVNICVCYCKIQKPKTVIKYCEVLDTLIDIDTHSKALYCLGKAYLMLSRTDEALEYFKKSHKLEPKNIDIGAILIEIDEKNKKSAEDESRMWKKAFSVVTEKKVKYDVDKEFESDVLDMCKDLAGRNVYSKFQLPNVLTDDQILCIQTLASQFEGLVVSEEGTGKRKRITIIKKVN